MTPLDLEAEVQELAQTVDEVWQRMTELVQSDRVNDGSLVHALHHAGLLTDDLHALCTYLARHRKP